MNSSLSFPFLYVSLTYRFVDDFFENAFNAFAVSITLTLMMLMIMMMMMMVIMLQ